MTRRKLNGDHNQCPACGQYFNSTFAFDKHRIGAFGVDRRCMSPDEMVDAGMGLNLAQWWVSSRYELAIGDANPSPVCPSPRSPGAVGRG